MVYVNTLNYAYDTLGTIIQYTLQFNTLYISSDTMSSYNNKTNELLGYVVNTFTNNTMLKFYEELGKVGLDNSGIVAPEITVDEELFNDILIQTVCALEVRYDFGNSFFAHPSVRGNQQIKDAVMDALANGSHSDSFVNKKKDQYEDRAEELLDSLRKKAEEMIKKNIVRLGRLVAPKIKCIVKEFINSFCEDVRAVVEKNKSTGTIPEALSLHS